MRRGTLLITTFLAALVSGCGPTPVVITAELSSEDAIEGTPGTALGDLEVRLIPFDRDAIFDSLAAVAPRPEPPIPDSVLQANTEVATAQQEWRNAEARWGVLRDTLQALTTALEGLNRGQAQYRLLFSDFQDLEAEYNGLDRANIAAFNRFDDLQKASITAEQEIRLIRQEWGDEAFANVNEIMTMHQRESGRDILYDTTDANGTTTFDVKAGVYWVVAIYEEPYSELYWNYPITVPVEEGETIPLTRENATSRPKY
ncbi:MAG TPA: hypothetical protein EYQ69_06635 [Gemmatimonadetes bacterium]|jgi:hypothetical protein|nr:hypothetical protein [Gemmatimonadota bacterium]